MTLQIHKHEFRRRNIFPNKDSYVICHVVCPDMWKRGNWETWELRNVAFSCKKKTRHMSQCAWHVRTCSKLIFKNIITSQFIWVAPNRSHQTCSGLWAPAPGHILRSAHVPTFTVPFQFLNAFKLKQELSGENVHELNSCLQISYRNSRLNWISRLQSIYLSDCEKVYFLCSAQNISLNGDLGMAIPCLRPSPRTVYKP